MKVRHGFVSNSSSSSFVIARAALNPYQEFLLDEHERWAGGDRWSLTWTEHVVEGYTYMDNFDMFGFLLDIGVPGHHIHMDRNA